MKNKKDSQNQIQNTFKFKMVFIIGLSLFVYLVIFPITIIDNPGLNMFLSGFIGFLLMIIPLWLMIEPDFFIKILKEVKFLYFPKKWFSKITLNPL